MVTVTRHIPTGWPAPHALRSQHAPRWKCWILKPLVYWLFVCLLIAIPFDNPGSAHSTKLVVPNDLQLLMMIKTTLIAFNQANMTGNYTVLRDLGTPDFQQMNTAARLSQIFQPERNKDVDLSPIILLRPNMLQKPSIDAQGLLRVEGYFPSRPKMVYFTLAFQNVDDKWRLVALGVKTFAPAPAVSSRFNSGMTTALTAGKFAQSYWPANAPYPNYWAYWPYRKAGLR
jgi:hypothetical protein